MNQYSLVGGKSKGKTLAQVAKLHGMTADELRPQFVKGTKHELEHTNSSVIAKRIALDHLVEFPDYYDRLDKVEKMKRGAVLETPVKFNDIVLYHEKKGSWLFAKGNFYAWLYDEKGVGEKIESGEYDFVMFPPMGKGSPFSDKYVPPLLMVWNKTYQKKFKGAEHLLGIVQGFYDEDTNEIFIDMMTTNPKYRRQGINAHIIKSLREEFGVSKENVIFEKPTKEGTKFMQSGKFERGGISYSDYVDSQFDEDTDRYLPSDYFEPFEIETKNLDDYPIVLQSKNGFDYREWKYGGIGVFQGNKIIGFADNGSIQVSPQYQGKGIGLELVVLLKKMNPNHRFGNMTPQGRKLMDKFYDSYIANKMHLGGDMSKHLAPNGKPSNLNHEQWHLVRTPEFKTWFGDWENDPKNASKVVDENGEPLVVYHGSIVETNFDIFDYKKADLGFHFGTKEQAKKRVESKGVLPSRKSIVNSFFLNIRVLFEMTDVGEWQYPQRYIDELMSDNIIEEKVATQKGFLSLYMREDNAIIRDYLKSKYGNSVGFVYNNKYEGKGKSFIVLSPNEIKVADGSNTTFDSANPSIMFHLGGDMSKHLAPNGKPSNLTHEQWHLVRTPEFKAWFGDWENDPENASKVVDENGEPLVVYRGSKSKNPNYIPHKHELSNGIYFSTKKDVAELYTKSFWQNWVGRIFECFLNIRNIEYYDTLKLKSNIYQEDFEFYNKLVIESKKNNFDGICWDNFIDVPDLQVIFPKEPEDYMAKTFIVFEPNQIKLADGTNTTFDSGNPDIRFEKGGLIAPNGKPSNLTHEQWHLVRTPEFKAWFGDWENDPNDNMLIDKNGEPMIWWHTGGDWTKLNDDGINGKGKLMFSPTERSMAYSRDGEQTITRPFFIKSDFIYVLPYEDRDKISAYRWNKNKKNPIWFVNAYGGFVVVRQSNQIKLADGTNTNFDSNNPDIGFAKGGRTIAQTPAPASDRKYGSKTNPKGSASDSQLAKSIKFNDKLEKAIENKVEAYNEKHRNDKVGLSTAKAVVRRGMGAYSKSHRPTISGGAPNSRQAWGLARLNKFLLKKSGEKVKSAYVQDDDLLKYANGGQLELEIKSNPYLKPTNCTDISDVDYALDSLRELDAKYGADNPKLLKIWEKMLERKKYLESKK